MQATCEAKTLPAWVWLAGGQEQLDAGYLRGEETLPGWAWLAGGQEQLDAGYRSRRMEAGIGPP